MLTDVGALFLRLRIEAEWKASTIARVTLTKAAVTTSGAMTIFNYSGQFRFTLNLQCVAGMSNLATAAFNGQQFLVSFGPRVN